MKKFSFIVLFIVFGIAPILFWVGSKAFDRTTDVFISSQDPATFKLDIQPPPKFSRAPEEQLKEMRQPSDEPETEYEENYRYDGEKWAYEEPVQLAPAPKVAINNSQVFQTTEKAPLSLEAIIGAIGSINSIAMSWFVLLYKRRRVVKAKVGIPE